jgi:excisionase family DNA binding protein
MPTEFLTVREVAERLKLNPQTVRRWIRAGLLPASRIGRRQWRVRVEDAAVPPEREGRDLARRRAAVARIRELREELRRQGVRIDAVELVRESRRELEARGERWQPR